MKVALLISTYNWVDALDLVLQAVLQQVQLPDEILIADDGSTSQTLALIETYRKKISIPIHYYWHEDKGFRKSRILNKAIAASTADYIIQIDGDCIAHPYFIRDHIEMMQENVFLYGSRVNIPERALNTVLKQRVSQFSFYSPLIKKRTRNLRFPLLRNQYSAKEGFSNKVRGCNISYWKANMVAVNGYNEDMEGWGREDSELIIRMLNNGIQGKRLKFGGIVYHIYHPEKSKEHLAENSKIQQHAIDEKQVWCANGINKYLEDSL